MAVRMFTWRACDHSMKEAITSNAIYFKKDHIENFTYEDCLDLFDVAETTADCFGHKDGLGIGITYENYFLEVTSEVEAVFHKIEFSCPTELFTQKNLLRKLQPFIHDRDRAMTISFVCWNPELYSDLETAIDEDGITRTDSPINGSSSMVVYDMINAIITGASVHSASGVAIAIENDDWYIDLTVADGMDVMALNEFDAIEHAFDMDEFAPYLKEIA